MIHKVERYSLKLSGTLSEHRKDGHWDISWWQSPIFYAFKKLKLKFRNWLLCQKWMKNRQKNEFYEKRRKNCDDAYYSSWAQYQVVSTQLLWGLQTKVIGTLGVTMVSQLKRSKDGNFTGDPPLEKATISSSVIEHPLIDRSESPFITSVWLVI